MSFSNPKYKARHPNCSPVPFSYPHDIPSGTSVPAWAYADVVQSDNFNATAAKALADRNLPESTTAGGATSSASRTATGTSPSSSSPVVTTSSGGGSNAGAIAGGVVGGIVGLALIAGVAFWFYRKQNAKSRLAASAQYATTPVTPFTDDKPTYPVQSPQLQQQPLISPTYVPQSVPTPPPPTGKIYVSAVPCIYP